MSKEMIPDLVTVKQKAGDYMCVAACAATLLGMEPSELLSRYHYDVMGKERKKFWTMERLWRSICHQWAPFAIDLPNGFESGGDMLLSDFYASYALVVCESKTLTTNRGRKAEHLMVWDAREQMIRDPSPYVDSLTDPGDYDIKQWIPVSYLIEQDEEILPSELKECHG